MTVRSGPIVFVDSGVGGLSYLAPFRALAPAEPLIYIADRAHFPYGPRPKEELIDLLVELIARIRAEFSPKLIVIACNTASVSAIAELRIKFPSIPFVGTVPAVKPAALSSKKRRIGVLATERTVKDPYIALLSERFAPGCALVGLAAPELVNFVEKEYPESSAEIRRNIAEHYVQRFLNLDVDALVLGCTHFLFLAEEFSAAAGDALALFDSREGVARRALYLLDSSGSRAESLSDSPGTGSLYLTGGRPIERGWKQFAAMCDLELKGILGAKP